jgi:ATPase subunit of ABC transporter with duplicated ATPase domains
LLKRPDVLLLDEPTNNLDRHARRRLWELLDGWPGCLLIVSHDRELLNRVDQIAELDQGEIRFYGGNYPAYEQAIHTEREAAERAVRHAEQEVKREKVQQQQARERAARRAGNAVRTLHSAGLPRIIAGGMKRNAQKTAARNERTHASRIADAQAKFDDASRVLPDDQAITLVLPATAVPTNRMVFVGKGVQIRYGNRTVFADSGVNLIIRGPERIALTGPNGSGKSTLLRVLEFAVLWQICHPS